MTASEEMARTPIQEPWLVEVRLLYTDDPRPLVKVEARAVQETLMDHAKTAHEIANETVELIDHKPWQFIREFLEARIEAALTDAWQAGYRRADDKHYRDSIDF